MIRVCHGTGCSVCYCLTEDWLLMKTDDRLFRATHQIPPRPSIVGRYCSEKSDILGASLKTSGWNHNRASGRQVFNSACQMVVPPLPD